MELLRAGAKLGRRALVVLTVAGATLAAGTVPSQAASYPLPVKTSSGANQEMPDPGVLLYSGHFYAFSTGTGLEESTSTIAAGPWSKPTNTLDMSSLPSWVDRSKAIWAPDMIRATSGTFVVYFSAALTGTSGNPAGNDAKPASGARCIGTATSSAPMGPFTADQTPLVCFSQYGAPDPMTADPANRVRGEGLVDPSPGFRDYQRQPGTVPAV